MLRKRTRSHQKAQMISGTISNPQSKYLENPNQKTNSLFSIPYLFIGLNNKGSSDYDSVWSPTSPLDIRVCSNIRNPFSISPRPSPYNKKEEMSCKVGLGIVDSFEDNASQEVKVSSECKNICFGIGMRIKIPKYNPVEPFQEPRLLPKDNPVFPRTLSKTNTGIVFEIGDDPLDPLQLSTMGSCVPISAHSSLAAQTTNPSARNVYSFPVKPSLQSLESLSENEIELSEDYTCIISHGPNPKTTRIYDGCVIDSPENKSFPKSAAEYPLGNFLSFCHSCNRKLEEGKDVYIYRGEKAFCSCECRLLEITNEEEKEKTESLKISSRLNNKQ